jgi:spore coat polysaccharide biosynthesis predicted glycosyltransferase SpsG
LHLKRVPSGIDATFADLRAMGCKLIAVDALADHSDFLDLVFIPSFQVNASSAKHSTEKYIYGWDCFLLNVRQSRRPWHIGNNVLALSGGSDATRLGQTWPSRLNAALPSDTVVHWVTGPFAAAPVWPERPRTAMTNYVAPKGLDGLMLEANFAVTVYGVSFYELLYYGVPTVVFSPYGSKDNAELRAIGEMGLAILADDEIDATEKLVALMADENRASALSRRAMEKMTVLGGHTFAKHAAALLE